MDRGSVQRAQRTPGFMEMQQSSACSANRTGPIGIGSTMVQPGKVLRLYVEVRSVSEDDQKFLDGGGDGTNQPMLLCPDLVSDSQRSSRQSSPTQSPDLYRAGCRAGGSHSSSRSSSRHSVSFQLQNPHPPPPLDQFLHQEDLDDTFDHLLEVLAPSSQSSHLGSTDMEPCCGKGSPSSSRWLAVPSTYSNRPRSCELAETVNGDGRTSLVSFGFIEKGSVNSLAGHQQGLDPHLRRTERRQPPGCSQKRTSDLGRSGDESSSRRPYLSKATMDAVARDATRRALEEFGSPELRRRFEGHSSRNRSPSLPRHTPPPRCRSPGGSSVQSRGTLTLPSRTELLEMDRRFNHGSVNVIPRSPASDCLCAETRDSFYSAAKPHCPSQSPQTSWAREEGHRPTSRFHPPLPAGRPTDIQHEVPESSAELHGGGTRTSSHPGPEQVNFSPTSRGPYHPSRCSSRTSDANSPISDRRSISPFSISDLDCKVLGESNRTSAGSADRRYKWTPSPTPSEAESLRSESSRHSGTLQPESPWKRATEPLQMENWTQNRKPEPLVPQTRPGRISPVRAASTPASPSLPSRVYRVSVSGSPVLDPGNRRTSSPSKDASTLHRYQPDQPTTDRQPFVLELLDRSPVSSPEVTKRNLACPAGSCTSTGPTVHQSSSRVPTQSSGRRCGPDAGVQKQLAKECQQLVLGVPKTQNGGRNHRDHHDNGPTTGTVSSSSSGVTGSLGESLSPETWSQSSHGTPDDGSGTQVGWTGRVRRDRSTVCLTYCHLASIKLYLTQSFRLSPPPDGQHLFCCPS